MNNKIDILIVKNFVDKKINWNNYNASKKRNYRNTMMKEYKEGDLIIELSYLSYMLYEQYHKNVINAPSNIEERKQNIDLSNYVSKEKYDKIKKNSNHYKQQIENRNLMIKDLNNQYAEVKEELKDLYKKLDTLEVNYKKLEIEHSNLIRVCNKVKEKNYEIEQQNEELREENDNLYNELSKLKKQYNII